MQTSIQNYKCLKQQVFSNSNFKIVPIRYEDRFNILKWRNEQIYHLRQNKLLSREDQENYFNTVLNKLFKQEQPNQLLFSYLQDGECIGYGGLVHINWIDKNAEISFVMDTKLEKEYFSTNWKIFLKLIEEVAFIELNFHKIFTFAFDLRLHLYAPIEDSGFVKEARLKEHCFFNGTYKDVVIHSKLNTHNKL
jgi:RimJ/RimL family protein N-acetyltransferase